MIAIARLISVFFETYDSDNLLEKANKFFSKNTSLVYVTLAVIIVFSNNAITRYKENYINEKKYPVETVKYIKENLDYKNSKIYNSWNFKEYRLFLIQEVKYFVKSLMIQKYYRIGLIHQGDIKIITTLLKNII